MALGALPQNIPSTIRHINSISDETWHQAGDRAIDLTWYTKRALANKIYVATELFLLQDNSAQNEATWEFLDRRIDNVIEIGKIVNKNQNLAQAVQTGLGSIFSLVIPAKFDDSEMLRKKEELRKREEQEQ